MSRVKQTAQAVPGADRADTTKPIRNLIGFDRVGTTHEEALVVSSVESDTHNDRVLTEEEDTILAIARGFMQERTLLGHSVGPGQRMVSLMEKVFIKYHDRII